MSDPVKDPVREATVSWALELVEGEPRMKGEPRVKEYDIARQVIDYDAEVARLRAELDEANRRTDRLSDLLTRTADALKGPPDDLVLHDWSDLPAVAAGLRAPVTDMRLCEQGRVGLRPGQIYRFTAAPGCEGCALAAAPYTNEADR